MARSEKYNKGSSWRDQFLKFKRKKEKKKDLKPVFKTEDDLFKRIGSADNDYSTETYYEWHTTLSNYVLSSDDEAPRMRSLRELCAMRIAEHHELINHELLKTGNWSVWHPVWRYLVRWRRDNYKLFQTFVDTFASEAGFASHDALISNPITKYKTILSSTQDAKRHRVERFFSNIKLDHFTNFVNGAKFQNLAILEIVKDLQDQELIELTNLTSLTALKVVQSAELKDTIVNSWCSAIKSHKWTKLQVLCLPRVSESSVVKLQRLATSSRLLYIEISFESSRFDLRKQWKSIDLIHWDLISERSLIEQPLGMKLHVLLSLHKLEERSIVPSESTFLLDFNIVDTPLLGNQSFISQRDYDDLWNLGQVRSCSLGLLLKKEPKPQISDRTVPNGVKRKKANPKSKMASVNSFFDL